MTLEKKNKLSFIIPVYNAELYLNKCVDSILSSDSKNIEIILVDDGSTDKSGQICDKYSKTNKTVKVIHQKNEGVASARNTGTKESSGDYIFFVDNDDWIDGTKIENLLNILNESQPDIVINKSLIVTPKNNFIKNDFISKKKINGKSTKEVINYFRKSRIKIGAPWQYVIKKEIVTGNNIAFNSNQNGVDDSFFSTILFISCKSFYLNEDVIYFWRLRADSQGKTYNYHDYIQKMISSIESLNEYINKTTEKYKISFIYFNIYKNIYALLGQYYKYPAEEQKLLHEWYKNNKNLLVNSLKYSGAFHRLLNVLFGNFNSTILSYKFAVLKGKIFMYIYNNSKEN